MASESHEAYLDHHHKSLLSNCFAQSEALMRGRSFKEISSMLSSGQMKQDEFENRQNIEFSLETDLPQLFYTPN